MGGTGGGWPFVGASGPLRRCAGCRPFTGVMGPPASAMCACRSAHAPLRAPEDMLGAIGRALQRRWRGSCAPRRVAALSETAAAHVSPHAECGGGRVRLRGACAYHGHLPVARGCGGGCAAVPRRLAARGACIRRWHVHSKLRFGALAAQGAQETRLPRRHDLHF